jgi:hypothetical protein
VLGAKFLAQVLAQDFYPAMLAELFLTLPLTLKKRFSSSPTSFVYHAENSAG